AGRKGGQGGGGGEAARGGPSAPGCPVRRGSDGGKDGERSREPGPGRGPLRPDEDAAELAGGERQRPRRGRPEPARRRKPVVVPRQLRRRAQPPPARTLGRELV